MNVATSADLKAIERLIAGLSKEDRKALEDKAASTLAAGWLPQPGPQTMAYESKADVLLYGGSAGGGKSAMLVGLAATRHHRALIVRREASELDGLIAESRTILTERGSYNGQDKEWTFDAGKSLKFGGMKEPDDWRKYAGRARDFIGFDEAAEFLEEQVASILAWLRSTDKGQRCRMVLASNPPRSAEGEWIIDWFAPWLSPSFPNPAKAGELRWCIVAEGERRWVDGPEPILISGAEYTPLSYTFIPARLDDNLFLSETDYRRQLQNMPGSLRGQLLDGDFLAGRQDDEWQVIPTAWIREAQARWKPDGMKGLRMTALAVDVAQGGSDLTTLSHRYGTWFGELQVKPGAETPDPPTVAGLVAMMRRDAAVVVVDIGGGYGGGVVSYLKDNDVPVVGFNASNSTPRFSQDGQLRFFNKRAEAWWRLREALDPSQEGGSPLALPDDPVLYGDLAAPRWKLVSRGIQIESKDDIRARLGRSTDRGDAVVMCWGEGQALAARKAREMGRAPRTLLGYSKMKARR